MITNAIHRVPWLGGADRGERRSVAGARRL